MRCELAVKCARDRVARQTQTRTDTVRIIHLKIHVSWTQSPSQAPAATGIQKTRKRTWEQSISRRGPRSWKTVLGEQQGPGPRRGREERGPAPSAQLQAPPSQARCPRRRHWPFCGLCPRSCLPGQFSAERATARLPARAAGNPALLPEGLEAPVRGAPGPRAPCPAQLASPSVNSSLMDCLRDLQSGRSKPKSAHSSGPAAPAPPAPPRPGMVMV